MPHPESTAPLKVAPTQPVRPETYLASTVDVYFMRDKESKVINFTCELAGYRRKGNAWDLIIHKVEAKDLTEFLKLSIEVMESLVKEMPSGDQPARRVRVYLDPFPGEGVYDRLRQQAEKAGWKVDRKDVPWQPSFPDL